MLLGMANDPIVFMANPDPEIEYNLAKYSDLIMAQGDLITPTKHNVLGFSIYI
jgi:malic enzyme